MSKIERTYYMINSYSWYEPGQGQSGFWVSKNSKHLLTAELENAHKRVKEEYSRVEEKNRDKVKYEIIKVTEFQEKVEELTGPDITALFLKT